MERTVEELEQEINSRKQAQEEAYARARAEAETKEVSTIVQDTSKTLQVKLNQKVANKIETSAEIDKKIDDTTEVLVNMGLETQQNQVETELKKSEKEKAKADFELNEDQFRAFGQDTSPKEEWKKKLIYLGYNFWFVVITFICFFTLAPFYIFTKVIKTQQGILRFVVIAVGVMLLLACLGGLTYGCLKWTGVIG